jgi:hypothetical protein
LETSIRAMFTMIYRSLIDFIASGGLLLVLAASLDELITRDLGRSIRAQEMNISRTNMRKWCRRMHLDSWKSLLHLPAGCTLSPSVDEPPPP